MKLKFLLIFCYFVAFANLVLANDKNTNLTLYTGVFDTIDKEGDDKASLFGIEHRDSDLFRNTILGKISPITGIFMTDKNSIYLYTGIEGNYNIGPLELKPSFAPGYYEKGNGKELGDVLEFKSEINVGIDLFGNGKIELDELLIK